MLVTPLQLALAYGTFGNGGTLNAPAGRVDVRQSAATLTDGQLGADRPHHRPAGAAQDRPSCRRARPDHRRPRRRGEQRRGHRVRRVLRLRGRLPHRRQDRHRARSTVQDDHCLVREHPQPREQPQPAAVRGAGHGGARRLRRRGRRADRPAGHQLPHRPHRRAGAGGGRAAVDARRRASDAGGVRERGTDGVREPHHQGPEPGQRRQSRRGRPIAARRRAHRALRLDPHRRRAGDHRASGW